MATNNELLPTAFCCFAFSLLSLCLFVVFHYNICMHVYIFSVFFLLSQVGE